MERRKSSPERRQPEVHDAVGATEAKLPGGDLTRRVVHVISGASPETKIRHALEYSSDTFIAILGKAASV